VTTYRLAYLPDEHDLCAACVERGDHDCGSLGPVSVGEHDGECDGAAHRGPATRLTAADIRELLDDATKRDDDWIMCVCSIALDGPSASFEERFGGGGFRFSRAQRGALEDMSEDAARAECARVIAEARRRRRAK
jgi:hypothetical protein